MLNTYIVGNTLSQMVAFVFTGSLIISGRSLGAFLLS